MAEMHAGRVSKPLVLDGRLDKPAWAGVLSYEMGLTEQEAGAGKSPIEGGSVRLLWDDQYLYVGLDLVDSDLVQEDDRDQQHHYQTGDVAEVFLGPVHDDGKVRHYWEFYVTPNGKMTAFFYPSRGRLPLPSTLDYVSDLRVAVQIDGTLNDWRSRDRGWTAEVAIPRDELARQGAPLEPGQAWRVLIGRYNYSAYLSDLELTMYPPLPVRRFHHHDHWADLVLESAANSE